MTSADIRGAVRRAVQAHPGDPPGLYAALLRDGWTTVGVPETRGGAGGGLADAIDVVAAIASAGVGLPVAEMTIVGARLFAAGGIHVPAAARCVVAACVDDAIVSADRVTAHARRVPWGRWASHLVLACPDGPTHTTIALIGTAHGTVTAGMNLADEPRDDIRLVAATAEDVVTICRPYQDVAAEVRAAGALARSVQMAAATQQVLDMTARYCTQRIQFGNPIGTLQAVQQQLAELAAENAAARAAVTFAVTAATAASDSTTIAMTEIAVAKARTSQTGGVAARIAHQLHGAIGVTREHALQRYSRALWSWREEYGSQAFWSEFLAARLADHSDDCWEWLTRDEPSPAMHLAECD